MHSVHLNDSIKSSENITMDTETPMISKTHPIV
jgi:hypothetical protein